MDGPNIRSGDVKSFKGFALRVRALVGMLNQLGSPGWTELKCGSHVSRLLAKLPHDLILRDLLTRFRLLSQPCWISQTGWSMRFVCRWKEPSMAPIQIMISTVLANTRSGFVPQKLTTVLHGREQKVGSLENPKAGYADSDRSQENPKKYCPFCDTVQHYMNQCSNFKLLTKEQIESWIRTGNRCWRCGQGHLSSRCTLKAKCKRCERRHLDVLHDVNSSSDTWSSGNLKMSEKTTSMFGPASQTLYLDRPTSSKQVLLKLSRVILQNGNMSLETYSVLDDGFC